MSTWPSWTNKCKGYFLWDFRGNASLPLLKARKGTFSSDCHGKRMFQTVKPFLEPEPGANLKKRSDTKDGQKVFKPMEPWSMWWISESNFTRRYMPLNHQSLSQQMPLFAYASFRWFFFFFLKHKYPKWQVVGSGWGNGLSSRNVTTQFLGKLSCVNLPLQSHHFQISTQE